VRRTSYPATSDIESSTLPTASPLPSRVFLVRLIYCLLSCAFCPCLVPPTLVLPVMPRRRTEMARLARSHLRKSGPTSVVQRFAYRRVSLGCRAWHAFIFPWWLVLASSFVWPCQERESFRAEALFLGHRISCFLASEGCPLSPCAFL